MKKIIISIAIFSILIGANLAHAQSSNSTTACDPAKTLCNPLKVDSIQDIIFLAVDLSIYVGVSFAILALIFVGFQFVAAQGNEEKLKDAKKWFFYIIIGLAILISAKLIVIIVKNTLINAGVVDSKVFTP